MPRTQTSGTTTTLSALLHDVVSSEPGADMLRNWPFDSAADVSDKTQSESGSWARTASSPVGTALGARDTLLDEAAGGLLDMALFAASKQYCEVSMLFPGAYYSKHHVSARMKLVGGGGADGSCPAQAELFVVTPVPPLYPLAIGETVARAVGAWHTLNFDVPEGNVSSDGNGSPTNSARIDQLRLRIATYPCE